MFEGTRNKSISSFSAAFYFNHEQGGDYNQRAESKKGRMIVALVEIMAPP